MTCGVKWRRYKPGCSLQRCALRCPRRRRHLDGYSWRCGDVVGAGSGHVGMGLLARIGTVRWASGHFLLSFFLALESLSIRGYACQVSGYEVASELRSIRESDMWQQFGLFAFWPARLRCISRTKSRGEHLFTDSVPLLYHESGKGVVSIRTSDLCRVCLSLIYSHAFWKCL